MVVYVVSQCCDEEYGCREAERVFARQKDAEAYVAHEIEEYYDGEACYYPWFDEEEHGVSRYSIEEMEVH